MKASNKENEKAASGGSGLFVDSTTHEKLANGAKPIIRHNWKIPIEPEPLVGGPAASILACKFCRSDVLPPIANGKCKYCGNQPEFLKKDLQRLLGGVE